MGPPQRLLMVKSSPTRLLWKIPKNLGNSELHANAFLQFAQEAKHCLVLVSPAATTFIEYNYFFIHCPFSLHLLESLEKTGIYHMVKLHLLPTYIEK